MRIIGNIIWLLIGGLEMAIAYFFAAAIMVLLIVTIPFGLQALKLASFTLWPFGRTLVERADAGAASFVGNVLWFLLAGWWLALGHVITALVLFVTIIGIPFGVAHLKLAGTALWPFGREIVPVSDLGMNEGAITVSTPPLSSRRRRTDGPSRQLPSAP